MMKKSLQTALPAATGQTTRTSIHWFLVVWIVVVALLDTITSADNLPSGIRFFTMQANSMSPAVPSGSLIITKPHSFYQISEIITFEFPTTKETVTHRVVNLSEQDSNTYYITRGDNNDLVDRRLIPVENIFGKVVAIIPIIGWLIEFIETKFGLFILVAIPATLIARKEILIIKEELSKRKGK
ncbi:signal peptidase I [Patescibacteria group bacterium]